MEDHQNHSAMYCVIQLYALIPAVFTGEQGLGKVIQYRVYF